MHLMSTIPLRRVAPSAHAQDADFNDSPAPLWRILLLHF